MRRLALILLIVLLAGCRTFEIGFVQTPTPNRPTPIPTASLTLPATATPDQSTATPTATAAATITPAATRRPVLRPTSIPIAPSPVPTLPPLPRILTFTVEPLVVDPGETVTLRWGTTGTEQVDIYQYTPDTVSGHNTVHLPASGEMTQTILDRQRLWHTFELSLDSGYGYGFVTQQVHVIIRCPYTYFFSPLPAEDREDWSCPDGEPITSSAAEQVFENGRMIWLQHDDRIYVFFDDGTYQTFDDTWVVGQPDAVPGLTPPEGRTLPVRGFGKVWSGDESVRSRLGWALAEERGFETQLQGGWIHCCFWLGTVNRPIYLRNREGRIIRLWPGQVPPGQWRFITQ